MNTTEIGLLVFAIFVLALFVTVIVAVLLLGKDNRDRRTVTVLWAVAITGVIVIFGQFLSTGTNGALALHVPLATSSAITPTSTPQMFSKNLSIACGDCEQPLVTVTLTAVTLDKVNKDVILALRFYNGTTQNLGLQFVSIKLTDQNNVDYLGHGDDFLVGSGQSAIENVTFPISPQANVQYTLKMVVFRPNLFTDYYQMVTFTF